MWKRMFLSKSSVSSLCFKCPLGTLSSYLEFLICPWDLWNAITSLIILLEDAKTSGELVEVNFLKSSWNLISQLPTVLEHNFCLILQRDVYRRLREYAPITFWGNPPAPNFLILCSCIHPTTWWVSGFCYCSTFSSPTIRHALPITRVGSFARTVVPNTTFVNQRKILKKL